MKKRIIKLGLIGVGKWGINYINTINNMKNVKLSCICTRDINKYKNYVQKYKVYRDWKELVLKGTFDGLIIATPANTHIEIMDYCINLGIPIIVEKPLTKFLKQAEDIYIKAKNKKGIVFVDHIHLYHPSFKKLKEIASYSNNIDKVLSISGGHGPFRKDIRALWDWGTHDVAMCIDFFNETPLLLEASYLARSLQEEQTGEIIQAKLLFKKEIEIILIFGNLMKKKIKIFEITQNQSLLRYQPLCSQKLVYENLENNTKTLKEIIVEKTTPLTKLIETFRAAILDKKTRLNDLKLSVEVTKVISNIQTELDNKIQI